MKSSHLKQFLFYILSINLISNVLALKTEGILNSARADVEDYMYLAAIYGMPLDDTHMHYLGTGAVIDDYFVLSAASLIIDDDNGYHALKPMIFFVGVGSSDLTSGEGEVIYATAFYPLGYNARNGADDLIVIQLRDPYQIPEEKKVYPIRPENSNEDISEGIVSSYGAHNFYAEIDQKLRIAKGEYTDNSDCEDMAGSRQICIRMFKTSHGYPRGLCSLDAGAPYVVEQYFLVAIAGQPKENCDDTEKGSAYTYIAPFYRTIYQIIQGTAYGVSIIPNHPYSSS